MQSPDTLIVIYTTLAPDAAWEGYGKTMKATILARDPPIVLKKEVLFDCGSYTGGLSFDNKYLCGGGGTIAMLNLTSGKIRPDTATLYPQACNASISSSAFFTNTMMYLTMGVSQNIPPYINNGKPWGTWEVILINDNAKEPRKSYTIPDSASFVFPIETNPPSFTGARWHHPEWSNHPYFATATVNADRYFATDTGYRNTYYQERIYLINLKDSSYIEVMRPKKIEYSGVNGDNSGLHWPWLWVKKPVSFTEDPHWLIGQLTPLVNSSFNRSARQKVFHYKNGSIISEIPLSAISVFALNGKQIAKISSIGNKKIVDLSLSKVSGYMPFIIEIEFTGNCKERIFWIKN
jgi:hypothetical protein